MARPEVITVSMREIDRLKTVQAVMDGQLRPGVAAERLEITDRQLRRLLERYRLEGPAGLISRKRGRPSNNRLSGEREAAALGLIREHYADFGPTLAAEKLREAHGLTLAKETVRRLMMVAGLWVPRKQRPPKVYQPRNRRACYGELIQIDGCDHRWFEERAPACTLLVYVDDATSRIMELRFTHSEATFTYFAATRAYLERHGKPVAFYSDKASVFRVNKQGATSGDGHTQFARALFELNIEGICANSSQAKGRVERTHLTLQDRLVKELRLRGISTMEAANAFMAEFIADYNARFAKVPRNNHNAHRPLRPDENLDLIFAWREPRCVSKSLTIQYDKVLYLLADTPEHRKLAGCYIDVYHYPDGRIEPRANGAALPYTTYDRLSEVDQGAIVDNKRLGHVLQLAQYVQEKRDNTRSLSVPGTEGVPRKRGRPPGKKSQRSLGQNDMLEALQRLQEQPWPLNGTEN
ncbi:transposase (plasmid) [Cupriavidus taiwanensis]|uniref:Transposase n=1 Tax=Cupriavidus taiwanensis TaxID=164546 RepID=A0A375I5R7_9BURK|nr:ISNCY family transposase [Cupriavidus taiwanensis]SPK70114.1 transposase [Cupriavidus taiwanensis]SPK74921.1 transposase [Cupriavidus taiwanensis]